MLQQLVDLWGINAQGLIALEYRVEPAYIDLNLMERYAEFFSWLYPDFTIEYLERYDIILSPEDGWYLCCTQGDSAPVSIRYAQELTPEQLSNFATLSENFYQVVNSILGDADLDG